VKWLARLTDEQRAALTEWRSEHHWHPNQLRHTHGTRVRREYGLEAAQVVLGHAWAAVTQVCAEADMAQAVQVAAEIGMNCDPVRGW
jgi:site-specific recombinase XerC